MTTATIPAPSTRNILRVFRQIPALEIAEGRLWYPRARNLAEELADPYDDITDAEFDSEVRRAAAVIAVLSPMTSWKKNVKDATWLCEAYRSAIENPRPGWDVRLNGSVIDNFPGIKKNGIKALRILMGEDPEDVVKGPKVRQFWQAIVDPTDPRAVVVDRHAFDVSVNRVLTDAVRGKLLGKAGAYDNVADKYRRAAAIISGTWGSPITPAELQAITWVWWRKNRAAANHG